MLGRSIAEVDEQGVSIGPVDGSWPTIDFLESPEHKTPKNHVHFDLRADGATTADG